MDTMTRDDDLSFDYPLLLTPSFDRLLQGVGEHTSVDELIDVSLRRGRLLLQAPGGAGKTVTLHRIRRRAEQRGIRVGLVFLPQVPESELLSDAPRALLNSAVPALDMDDLANERALLLLVDGLNEVRRGLASLVLDAVEELASLGPRSGVIVSDRVSRRPIDMDRWRMGSIGTISRTFAEQAIGHPLSDSAAALLSSPAYLRRVLESESLAVTRSEIHREYFEEVLGFAPSLVDRLASHAFGLYRSEQRTSFSRNSIAEAAGEFPVEKLIEQGTIVRKDVDAHPDAEEFAYTYRHHLMHDYLASRAAIKEDPGLWGADLFDALSFSASSSDGLVMMLEQCAPAERDSFIRRVYDWNLYAAAYLMSTKFADRSMIKASTETEVLILLGERKFDRFIGTAEQVTDALLLHSSDLALRLLAARDAEEVLALAHAELPEDPDYRAWLATYGGDQMPAPRWMLERLKDEDGVDGWTAANVVRRLGLDEEGVSVLLRLADHPASVVRWRVGHALGVAGDGGLETLYRLFRSDTAPTVRYGALRSIMEQALLSSTSSGRIAIMSTLAESVHVLRSDKRLSREFARLLEVKDPPVGWGVAAGLVLERLLASAISDEEQESWRRISSDLRLYWSRRENGPAAP